MLTQPTKPSNVDRSLILGIDITWWGGSRNKRQSQFETIVAGTVGDPQLEIRAVDLISSPNPAALDRLTEPNFDRDGARLCSEILQLIDQKSAGDASDSHLVVCLDAPLEAAERIGAVRRRSGGQGLCRRQAEKHLQDNVTRYRGTKRPFIQPGSPVIPRVSRIVEQLGRSPYRMNPYRSGSEAPPHGLVEIFPAEALWALDRQGYYAEGEVGSLDAYKKFKCAGSEAEVRNMARRPLAGFTRLLIGHGLSPTIVDLWIQQLVDEATGLCRRKKGLVYNSKRFDDLVDSGIAFLTGVAYTLGAFHSWGDGTDGTIVGPGHQTDFREPLSDSSGQRSLASRH